MSTHSDVHASPPIPERIALLTHEELKRLLERLAHDEAVRQRIEELLAPHEAVRRLESAIERIGRRGRRYAAEPEGRELAGALDRIIEDIEFDVLPANPESALALVERLLGFETALIERDHDGDSVGRSLSEACVVWLKAAGVLERGDLKTAAAWLSRLCAMMRRDDFRVRADMLQHAHWLFTESQLREWVRLLENGDLSQLMLPPSALEDLAIALKDPALYVRALELRPVSDGRDWLSKGAEFYLRCGDATGALELIEQSGTLDGHEHLGLLDRIYRALGRTAELVQVRRKCFHGMPSLESFRRLEEVLAPAERTEFHAHVRATAGHLSSLATALGLLFALGDGEQAEELIFKRKGELDGSESYTLAALAESFQKARRPIVATLIWRSLLDDVLARSYSRAYHHALRYLKGLRQVSTDITDYRGLPTHLRYEVDLRARHRRKSGFWSQADSSIPPR